MSLKRRVEAIKKRLAKAGRTCRCGPCGIGVDVIQGEDIPPGPDGHAATKPRMCPDYGGERLVVLVLEDDCPLPHQRGP